MLLGATLPEFCPDRAGHRRVELGPQGGDVVVRMAEEQQRDVRAERRHVLFQADVHVYSRFEEDVGRRTEVKVLRGRRRAAHVQIDNSNRIGQLGQHERERRRSRRLHAVHHDPESG